MGLNIWNLTWGCERKKFHKHDEDIDIYVFFEDKNKILNLVYEFKKHGFEVARYEKNSLFSIIRKMNIDFFFSKKQFLDEDVLIIIFKKFFKKTEKLNC